MLPLPVTVITTIDAKGVANAAPYGCVMPILRPLDLIAIASALPRHTLANIRETREFVVNVIGLPSFDKAMLTPTERRPGLIPLSPA
jgi:flavin reductase (DIM6/NTAB) family NADH-FMN oxidoreductase RutF